MAKLISSETDFFLGVNYPNAVQRTIVLGTATRTWALGIEVESLDPTTLTDAGERVLAGKRKDSISWAGLFDNNKGPDSYLNNDPTGSSLFAACLGTGIGSISYAAHIIPTKIEMAAKLGEIVSQGAEFRVEGSLERGVILAYKQAFASGTVTLGSVDNGVQTTNGGIVYVFVHSGDGSAASGTDQFTVQHSTSGTGGWGNSFFAGQSYGTNDSATSDASGTTVQRYTRITKVGSGSLNISLMLMRR